MRDKDIIAKCDALIAADDAMSSDNIGEWNALMADLATAWPEKMGALRAMARTADRMMQDFDIDGEPEIAFLWAVVRRVAGVGGAPVGG